MLPSRGTYFFTLDPYRRQTFLTDLIVLLPFGHCVPMITISPTADTSSSASSPKVARHDRPRIPIRRKVAGTRLRLLLGLRASTLDFRMKKFGIDRPA